MHWISKEEKGMIKEWAEELYTEQLSEEYLPMPDKDKETYWYEYDDTDSISEYDFDNIPQLKDMFESSLTEDFYQEIRLPLAVATFKEKEIIQLDVKASDDDTAVQTSEKDEFSIPEFVYVF